MYPNLWKRGLIQARVRERANHLCEDCGMAFHQGSNLAVEALTSRGRPMVGTVHHIDEDKGNCSMNNLVFLCQRCHYTLHVSGWYPGRPLIRKWGNRPPEWLTKRGIPYAWNPNLPVPHMYERGLFEEETSGAS